MGNVTLDPPDGQDRVIEAQLDWLTCGWDAGAKADRALAWAFAKAQHERRLGFKNAPFRLMGFEGYAVGRVRCGQRDGAVLLQLSGDLAEQHAAVVAFEADRVSRVDLAVTVQLAQRDPFLGESAYAQASNYRAEHPKSAMPWLVQDDDGGCTAYVGHRASDRFLRIYNKHAESVAAGDAEAVTRYERCWRYELECKGGASQPTAICALAVPDRPAHIQQLLHDYCSAHGIEPRFPSRGDRVLLPGFRRRSDYYSRLSWLRKAVNPAILSMLEVGDRGEILDALGLGLERPRDT